jgi:peptide subunit release factor RF-3
LAPARLGWRTHPDLPDYKKAAKALQSVEASTHVGLLHKPHKFSRRLTLIGIHWVEAYKEILEENYSHKPVMASKSKNSYERVRQEIMKSRAWQSFKESKIIEDISDAAAALQCSPASPQSIWQSRVNNLKRASDVLQDQDLMEFAELIDNKFVGGENYDS